MYLGGLRGAFFSTVSGVATVLYGMLLTVSGVPMQHNATQTLSCNTVARLKPRNAGWAANGASASGAKHTMLHNPEKLHEVIKVNRLTTYPLAR